MTTRAGLWWWFIGLFLAALILAGAFYVDANVHTFVLQHQTCKLRTFMLAVSRWGDWPSHIVLGIAGAGMAYALGHRSWLRIFLAMIVACALAGAVSRVIKISVGRSRPAVTAHAGWNGPSLSSKYHAFPSGHTTSSAAFFTVPIFARRRIALALLPIPFLIAASRVLLDAHHLSDVVFAAMLGTLCAFLVWRFVSARYLEPA